MMTVISSRQLVWRNICLRCSGPEGTPFEGGIFPATLTFPKDYPLSPPTMKFTCDFFHPNVYPNGTVCISILHPPGDDPNMYESSSERWSPVQSVEKILLSVVSMLAGIVYLWQCLLWFSTKLLLSLDMYVQNQTMKVEQTLMPA